MSDTLNIKQSSLFSQTLILIKHRLSFSVVFSSVCSYLIAFDVFSLTTFLLLIIGGFFVVGSSNGFNQIIERRRDALMMRTSSRPLPSGEMTVNQDDYKNAGFKMLPSGKRDNATAFQIVFYTIWMIIVSTLPYFSFTGKLSIGIYSLILILVSGSLMLYQALKLMRYKHKQNAIRLMYASIFYLSFIQIIFVIDKFIFQ